MLRQACHEYYDELIKWREMIMRIPKLPNGHHRACQEGIKTLQAEKLKLDEYFRDFKDEIQTRINIYRNTTQI